MNLIFILSVKNRVKITLIVWKKCFISANQAASQAASSNRAPNAQMDQYLDQYEQSSYNVTASVATIQHGSEGKE